MGNDLGPTPWRHLPSDRVHAPGPLRLVEAFVNTVNHERGDDAIATVAGLEAWLREFGLDGGALEDAIIPRAHALREAFRGLMRANAGHPVHRDDLATIERASREGSTTIDLAGWPATRIVASPGIENVLALLVAILHQARCEGSWQRMRSCGNDGCQWAFYDRSRNASATWCSMTICGNRRKVRSYRARRTAA
jgi:predicted RNA-binding Zn ribbon-like protein